MYGQILRGACGLTPVGLQYLLVSQELGVVMRQASLDQGNHQYSWGQGLEHVSQVRKEAPTGASKNLVWGRLGHSIH